jgi:hypothetical protein
MSEGRSRVGQRLLGTIEAPFPSPRLRRGGVRGGGRCRSCGASSMDCARREHVPAVDGRDTMVRLQPGDNEAEAAQVMRRDRTRAV